MTMQHPLIQKLWRFFKIGLIIFLIFSVSGVLIYRFFPVPFTPLMCQRVIEQAIHGEKIHLRHDWIPIEKMSPNIIQAAIAGEDNNFVNHYGVDFEAIKKAQKYNKRGKRIRGASTITQQTCKNVYLWLGRNYLRKGLEVYFTFLVETVWSKERIMEVYLNVIETGNGIYGVEKASQTYFKKSSARLSQAEAALIAALLPSPRKYSATNPGPYMQKRKNQIQALMGKIETLKIEK